MGDAARVEPERPVRIAAVTILGGRFKLAYPTGGRRRCQSVRLWKARAAARIAFSS